MSYRFWTTYEIKVVMEHYPTGGTKAVQKLIDRPTYAIRNAAGRYGIKANPEVYRINNLMSKKHE